MRAPERFGDSRRAQDTFRRIPAPRPENDVRPSSPDDFTFLDAQERRNQGLPVGRNQPTVQDTRRMLQRSHPNGDVYRPPRSNSERSLSPALMHSSTMRRRSWSKPRAPDTGSRDEQNSPPRRRLPFQPERRGSSPAPYFRDYRDSRTYNSFEPHPSDDWGSRETCPPPRPRLERQAMSPEQQIPSDSRPWQSSPAGPSTNAWQNETRLPLGESSHPVPAKRQQTQLFRNMSWRRPRSPPAQPSKPLVGETAYRVSDESNTEVEKAEVNGVKNVPTGPASKSGNPPVPQSVLALPHLFIPCASLPALQKTTIHLAKFLQRHSPVDVVVDDTGYFITFANSKEGRSKLRQCEKANDGELFFSKYTLSMKPYPLGQPQSQSRDDRQPSTKGHVVDPRLTDEGVPERERLGNNENENISAMNCKVPNSQAIPANRYRSSLHTPQPFHNPPARPMSPLDSTSSISGRTGSDVSGMGPRRCHVCKNRSELDNLVKCATCSRRYHRYCHTRKSIPAVPGDQWQCQRCERKKVPLNVARSTVAGNNVNGEATWPSNKEGTASETALHGSLDHEQTACSPPEQTQARKQAEQINHSQQRPLSPRPPSPTSHSAIDAVVAHQTTSTEILMASQRRTEQVQAESAHSDDAHFTEAQDLVEKSFSATASGGPRDRPDGIRRPGKLQLTKRKRIGTDERARPSDNDASIFDVPEGGEDEVSATMPPESTTAFASQHHDAEQAETAVLHEVPGGHINTHKPEQRTVDSRLPVASASPADSVLRVAVAKRTQGPNPKMAPCVDCGKQTGKLYGGPTRCSQCSKKATARAAEDAARLDQNEQLLQALRQGTPGAISASASDASARPSMAKDMPSQLVDQPVNDSHAEKNSSVEPDPVGSRDVHMTDEMEHDEEDFDAPDDDVDMVDEPDDAAASGHEDEPFLPGLMEVSLQPSTSGRKKGIKRKFQHAAAKGPHDLGNSFERPKGTYVRLAGIALWEAPGNRLQTNRIVDWISNNIPGYDKGEGSWADSLKSTLRLNATGRSGKIICTQVNVEEGDDTEAGRYWWVLKPDAKDKVDRWDYILQRPIPGPKVDPAMSKSFSELDIDDEDDDDDEIQRTALLDSASSSHSKKLKSAKHASRTSAQKNPYSATNAMDLDGLVNAASQVSQDVDSSDGEPLASQVKKQQQHTSFRSADYDTPSKSNPRRSTTSLAAWQHPADDLRSILAAPGAHPVRDDLGVRMLIQEEVENIDFSAKDFRQWPEYHSTNRFNRDQKLAEIKARPSRKQLFGKPASVSTLRSTLSGTMPPPSIPRLAVLRNTAEFDSIGKESEEMETPCDSLADFLGVREGITYVPCIHKGFLAYKDQNPHVRNPNTTDIRMHS